MCIFMATDGYNLYFFDKPNIYFQYGEIVLGSLVSSKWPIGVYRTTNPALLEIVNPNGSYKSMHFAGWTG